MKYFWIALLVSYMLYAEHFWALKNREIMARINAIEATVEPLAYDSVDYDNRLAKIEGKYRMKEEDSDAGK
jgi:hypothetical protein